MPNADSRRGEDAVRRGREEAPADSQSFPKLRPTPEQMRRGSFRQLPVKTDQGQVTNSAFRRQTHFEALAKGKSGIDEY
jgi:hypothetical protein